ncbi:MAG: LD-carboxypeptidase [Lachnospiraceae bacterium]
MNKKRKAALVGCSDPLDGSRKDEVVRLTQILSEEGLQVEISPLLFDEDGTAYKSGRDKAEVVNTFFRDPEMAFIFDISGGDLANSVLPYLDYDAIRKSRALFFGFSDLTTVINAIIAKTGRPAVNYQVRNLLRDQDGQLLEYFRTEILTMPGLMGKEAAMPLEIHFLRGTSMEGKILGGNVRCFLKLAGTPYFPDTEGAILLLEAYGGGVNQMMTALNQYQQLGILDRIRGVLLGTFTYMEKNHVSPAMRDMVLEMLPDEIPVAETRYVGHGKDARGIVLGQYTSIYMMPGSKGFCPDSDMQHAHAVCSVLLKHS